MEQRNHTNAPSEMTVTVYYCSGGPSLQNAITALLQTHMAKSASR